MSLANMEFQSLNMGDHEAVLPVEVTSVGTLNDAKKHPHKDTAIPLVNEIGDYQAFHFGRHR